MKQRKYHFCAIRQIEVGSMQYRDGIADTNLDPTNHEGYTALKIEIGKSMSPPQETDEGIIILSLTPLVDA